MLRRWERIAGNLVLTTELKIKLATVKILRLTFRALALSLSYAWFEVPKMKLYMNTLVSTCT